MSCQQSPCFTASLKEALRHPLYRDDRQDWLERQKAREARTGSRRAMREGKR